MTTNFVLILGCVDFTHHSVPLHTDDEMEDFCYRLGDMKIDRERDHHVLQAESERRTQVCGKHSMQQLHPTESQRTMSQTELPARPGVETNGASASPPLPRLQGCSSQARSNRIAGSNLVDRFSLESRCIGQKETPL